MRDELVDVGGYRLDVRVGGSGSPVVVCLSCSGGDHDEWRDLVKLLEPVTTVVTYCRAGIGRSDSPPGPRDARFADAAEELHALLAALDLAGPVVLVTSSIGALIADRYVLAHSDAVAGLVLLDPAPFTHWSVIKDALNSDAGRELVAAHNIDVNASTDGERGRRYPDVDRFRDMGTSPGLVAMPAVVVASAPDRWQRWPPRLPLDLPEADWQWQVKQREWAERLGAALVVTQEAGHFVHEDEPALVAYLVEEVLAAARRGERVLILDGGELAARRADIAWKQPPGSG